MANLKLKVIKDFDKFLKRLNKGYIENYDMILHQISFIQTCQYFYKIDGIYEFLMNN